MDHVVLDTDVASLAFKRRLPPLLLAQLAGKPTCITFVTFAEMTQWAEIRHWGPRNREALATWLSAFLVLPADKNVARVWGGISARAKLRGHPPAQNDTWIAACALVYGLPLATLNVKDFVDYIDHEGLVLISE
jgi:toxin FitB